MAQALFARLPTVKLLAPVPTWRLDLDREVASDIAHRHKATQESLARHREQPQRVFPARKQRKRRDRHELGEGYEQLPEPYRSYLDTAKWYARLAKADDREDLLHDILMRLFQTGEQLASRGQEFSKQAQIRVAEHTKDHYWYDHYAYYHGLECRHCSREQRAKCRANHEQGDKWFVECVRHIELDSLYTPVTDEEGHTTELGEIIADDKAIDLDEWLDARLFLLHSPIRLKQIAVKRYRGKALTHAEVQYLSKLRKRGQLTLSGFSADKG